MAVTLNLFVFWVFIPRVCAYDEHRFLLLFLFDDGSIFSPLSKFSLDVRKRTMNERQRRTRCVHDVVLVFLRVCFLFLLYYIYMYIKHMY